MGRVRPQEGLAQASGRLRASQGWAGPGEHG